MPLAPGDRLGPYEVLAPIGAGGMGEVFKARDTRLGRTVAVKVSAGRFNERFEREARAVAALSHPNVCTLYDVGPDYLVMEYIDGKPLKGPLPLETVLRYAREIAAALDAAHRLNIIHRDLKPANILVTKSGIKLLDFGLAKMGGPQPSSEETVTKALTEEGTILGTLQYMSPEQLEGKDADTRSDIFSFGCVLYEMITGRVAFQGESKASIIAAILDREPQSLTGVPAALARAIQRAMAKDPDERWQSVRDVAGVLDLAAIAPEAAPARRTSKLPLIAMAAVAALAITAAVWFALRTPDQTTWSGEALGGPAAAMGPRVSPDGHTLAFQAMIDGQTQVAVMKPETGNWTVLTHQKNLGQISEIAWSRDGSKLYFDRLTDVPLGVYTVPVLGGEPHLILEAAAVPQVFADGSLLVVRINSKREYQLHHFWPDTGKLELLPAIVSSGPNAFSVRTTPDGKSVVFFGTLTGARDSRNALYVFETGTGKSRRLAPTLALASGRLALAPVADSHSVIVGAVLGGLIRLVQVPMDGGSAVRSLLTLSASPWYIDAAPDGTIYADQVVHIQTLLRFSPAGGAPERLTERYPLTLDPAAVLMDRRPIVYTNAGAKLRFAVVEPGGGLSPLVESDESFGPPAAVIDSRRVAMLSDKRPIEIAIVTVGDGRVVSRVSLPQTELSSLAAAPDGKTLYFSSGGFVWSVPVTGGSPTQLGPGDAVTADPNGRDLIVSLSENEATRLVRMPVGGGAATPIEVRGDVRLATPKLTSASVGPDGRIVVDGASAAHWSYSPAIIDPLKHTISYIPVNFDGDISIAMWTADGRLIASGKTFNFLLCRFRPK